MTNKKNEKKTEYKKALERIQKIIKDKNINMDDVFKNAYRVFPDSPKDCLRECSLRSCNACPHKNKCERVFGELLITDEERGIVWTDKKPFQMYTIDVYKDGFITMSMGDDAFLLRDDDLARIIKAIEFNSKFFPKSKKELKKF